jgi:uncharacterized membrane protein
MAVWANLIVLLFCDWQAVHPALPKDVWVVLYVAGACTFLPTLIAVLMQKHISAVTVSFIYILEPVLGAVVSNIYLHEVLPLDGYIGGGLIVAGAIIHTWSSTERSSEHTQAQQYSSEEPVWTSLLATIGYALLFLCPGTFIVYMLGGFPPRVWSEFSRFWSALPTLMQQGQHTFVLLLVTQAVCWLIAWVSLALIALLSVYRVLRILFFSRTKTKTQENLSLSQTSAAQYTMQARENLVARGYAEHLPGMYQRGYQALEVRER